MTRREWWQQALLLAVMQKPSALERLVPVRNVSCGSDAADCCSAQCHFLQCRLQCLWEEPSMAAGLWCLDGDAADCCSGCSSQVELAPEVDLEDSPVELDFEDSF
jgi:hypothetical protein